METNDATIVNSALDATVQVGAETSAIIDPNLAEQEERYKNGFPCP